MSFNFTSVETSPKIMELRPRFNKLRKVFPISQDKCFDFKRSRDLICIFSTYQIVKNWKPFILAKFYAATTKPSKDSKTTS